MEGDGGDASAPSVEGGETSAPTQETNGPTTTADMPIAPVYAGYRGGMGYYGSMRSPRSRRQEFMSQCHGAY